MRDGGRLSFFGFVVSRNGESARDKQNQHSENLDEFHSRSFLQQPGSSPTVKEGSDSFQVSILVFGMQVESSGLASNHVYHGPMKPVPPRGSGWVYLSC